MKECWPFLDFPFRAKGYLLLDDCLCEKKFLDAGPTFKILIPYNDIYFIKAAGF